MKILKKRIFPAILAVCISGFLFAGFQIPDPNSEKMHSILYFLGLEEAYSGPCADMGCSGQGECTSYVVARIGSITVIRHCDGESLDSDSDDDADEDTEEPEEEEISQ